MANPKSKNRQDLSTNSEWKGAARKAAMNAGAYDGRFATRAVPNKRAQANRNACRAKVSL